MSCSAFRCSSRIRSRTRSTPTRFPSVERASGHAEAVRWGKRGARVNTISPGIIVTPLARDELTGPRGEGYRRMIGLSAAGRAGTPDEVGLVGALLMGSDGAFITKQRLPHGRRSHRCLLVREARPNVMTSSRMTGETPASAETLSIARTRSLFCSPRHSFSTLGRQRHGKMRAAP